MLEITVCRLQVQTSRVHLQTQIREPSRSKQHGKALLPTTHTISFRLTGEAWLGIQKQIAGSEVTAHEWCRKAALERLDTNYGLSNAERLLLEHFVRAQYLVTQGFQLLADDNSTGDQWKTPGHCHRTSCRTH
jgi:hypothetical protein